MKYGRIPFIILIGFLAVESGATVGFRYLQLPADDVEKVLLDESSAATREGRVLKIQTDKGLRTFEDTTDAGEGSAVYRMVGYLQRSDHELFLVRTFRHEATGYELLNKQTGNAISLYSAPNFSEDWSKFVDVSLDLEAGYMPNVIQIYKFENSEYIKVWVHRFPGWTRGPTDPVWLNNSAIVFFVAEFENDFSNSDIIRKPFIIEWKNGKWVEPRPLR
ncbi:MAG: hypothetical protein OEQ39_24235 [Gammaproteobacteria bacterium]|nr:hypothetical protein [Gammaproteobacteria bacterium]MDH3468892.1 hypothetical protein [Gammaproteobacteria bacterium]